MKVTGGCHCGHITYEAEVDPATVRVCHCTDCQKLTGTAFRAAIPSLPETFVLKSGTPKIYIKTAESGKKRWHALLPGMRHADLCRRARAEPVNLWIAVRRDRPARSTLPASVAAMVPLGATLVDGLASGREVGPPITVARVAGRRSEAARILIQNFGRWRRRQKHGRRRPATN